MSLKYYNLTYSVDHKLIGPEYPQAGPGKSYDSKSPYAYSNVRHNEFPDFVPDLNYFELNKKSPLTDFVSSGLSHGFIVNQKVKDILKDFNIVPHRFYPIVMKRGNDFFNHYFWMHIVSDLSDYVDFKKTKFYISNYLKKLNDVDISTKDEYLKLLKEFMSKTKDGFKNIEASQITLVKEFFELSLDMFIISYFDNKVCISEILKKRLLDEKITGIDIIDSNIQFR